MDAIVDTTVVIHLIRRYQPALSWFTNNQIYGVTFPTWMEVMEGRPAKLIKRSQNIFSRNLNCSISHRQINNGR
jgi:hypothetical protein